VLQEYQIRQIVEEIVMDTAGGLPALVEWSKEMRGLSHLQDQFDQKRQLYAANFEKMELHQSDVYHETTWASKLRRYNPGKYDNMAKLRKLFNPALDHIRRMNICTSNAHLVRAWVEATLAAVAEVNSVLPEGKEVASPELPSLMVFLVIQGVCDNILIRERISRLFLTDDFGGDAEALDLPSDGLHVATSNHYVLDAEARSIQPLHTMKWIADSCQVVLEGAEILEYAEQFKQDSSNDYIETLPEEEFIEQYGLRASMCSDYGSPVATPSSTHRGRKSLVVQNTLEQKFGRPLYPSEQQAVESILCEEEEDSCAFSR